MSLYCGAINQLLVLFHHDQLQSMFLWSTGTLTQTDWSIVQRLWPQLVGGAMLTLLLLRPLTLMGLDDGVARNLGLALSLARLAALTLAIVLSALLVNAVGIIGFIGLLPRCWQNARCASPAGATAAGPTDWSADPLAFRSNHSLAGARLDGSLYRVGNGTGWRAAVAVAVATSAQHERSRDGRGDKVYAERQSVLWFSLAGLAVLIIVSFVALAFGRDATGWHWATGDLLQNCCSGAGRGSLGVDCRGDAGGRGLYYPAPDRQSDGQPGSAGYQFGSRVWRGADAVPCAGKCLWLADACRKHRGGGDADDHSDCVRPRRVSPHRMLLAGMALSTAFTMLLMMLQASGDPRMAKILTGSPAQRTTPPAVRWCIPDRNDRAAGDCAPVPPLDDDPAAGAKPHVRSAWR